MTVMAAKGELQSEWKESKGRQIRSGAIDPYDSPWIPPQLGQYNCPLHIFLGANYQWITVAVGALVFDKRNRLLILQRSAEEPSFPSLWKIPGGSVEGRDSSILCALGRVLFQETGLNLSLIVRQAGPGVDLPAGISMVPGHASFRTKRVKLTFEVEVAELPKVGMAGRINRVLGLAQQGVGQAASNDLPIDLHPADYQRYLWVSEDDVRRSNYNGEPLEFISPEARMTLCAGFAIRRKDYGRAFADLLPINRTHRSADSKKEGQVWRQEIESGFYMTKNWDKFDVSLALADMKPEEQVFHNPCR